MKVNKSLIRKSHFLGTKIRNLRKRNHLTMEDLSARCVKVDPESAPSVSYLSMIERGKRVPSENMLSVIATVFQKEPEWFLDGSDDTGEFSEDIIPHKGSKGGIHGMPLEPSFLFSNEILQIAIPEMLSQTGTSGRQFAHLLIRAHQEHHQNHFPDLERAAEEVGKKRMPLSVEELIEIAEDLGLKVEWYSKLNKTQLKAINVDSEQLVSSYFMPPETIHLSNQLKKHPARLKYDLALHIGHAVLHNRDGIKTVTLSKGQHASPEHSTEVETQDILWAWRDFECSFFAGALLCPKVPFRQLLDRHSYEVTSGRNIDVSIAVAMRRMTAVSPYPHWHYFDAYSPGKLKAVYRGNGIPLPWGNMRLVEDPCQHWAVFRNINLPMTGSSAQLSILNVQGEPRIYCCESIKVNDLAEQPHVLCAGVDLNPAIEAQGKSALELAHDLKAACIKHGGSTLIPQSLRKELMSVARILNIGWVERSIESEARLICSRGAVCPRTPSCYKLCK